MSTATVTQFTRMSDTLERDVIRAAIARDARVSTFRNVKTTFSELASFAREVKRLMNQARRDERHFSSSEW